MTVLKLLLVRHGQSLGNTEGRMEGVSSTGLTPLGIQQSQQLGRHLATTGWCPTHLYCSPLQRAKDTLAAVAKEWGAEPLNALQTLSHPLQPAARVTLASGDAIPTEVLDDLAEYDCGIFTGLTWSEARDRYPDLCHRLETSLDWQPIPQAETLAQGQTRAQRVVDTLLNHGNGDRVLVISHQWILQQVIARLMGCDRTWGLPMGNTACFEFWLDRDRWAETGANRLNTELWQIKRFNDTSHCQVRP
jgi:broad specificity phosphatase PhoE